jgi:hypothetical protein
MMYDFLGYGRLETFVAEMHRHQQSSLLYQRTGYVPYPLYKILFDFVFLPRSITERVALATGTFGAHGYGCKTDNPVNLDFPTTKLSKYTASQLKRRL